MGSAESLNNPLESVCRRRGLGGHKIEADPHCAMKYGLLLLGCAALLNVAQGASEARFSIQNPTLHSYEDGPRVPSDQAFTPADTVYLTFELDGWKKLEKPNYEGAKLRLTWAVEATDPAGTPIAAPSSGKVDTDITAEDKHWLPRVRYNVLVPPAAPGGTYHLKIKAHDELGNADATADVPFQVAGRDVAPSDTLVIRNLDFYAAEDERKPLPTAAYRPGETVWVKFDITGYKFAQGNEFQVSYGIEAILPSGKIGLNQPDAATLADKSFYPQRYAPGQFSLPLPVTVATGTHTLIITAHDKIGNQTATEKATFSVE